MTDGAATVSNRCRLVASGAVTLLVAVLRSRWRRRPPARHVGGPVHGLADGALHPLTGIDHLLAMLAVGFVAASGGSIRRPWAVVAAFLGGMVVGARSGSGA